MCRRMKPSHLVAGEGARRFVLAAVIAEPGGARAFEPAPPADRVRETSDEPTLDDPTRTRGPRRDRDIEPSPRERKAQHDRAGERGYVPRANEFVPPTRNLPPTWKVRTTRNPFSSLNRTRWNLGKRRRLPATKAGRLAVAVVAAAAETARNVKPAPKANSFPNPTRNRMSTRS